MRALLIGGVAVFTAVGLFGQGGYGYRPYGYASRSGYGSVVFPGTGGPPPVGSITSPGFAARLGGQVSGFRPYRGGRGGGYGGAIAVPVPVIVGGGYGYYDPGYDPAQAQQGPPVQQMPNITIVMPPQAQAAPAAQGYYQQQDQPARPSVREYGPDDYGTPDPNSSVRTYQVPQRAAAPAGDDQPMFLIALKDNSIYTASAYWVEGDTLHYITTRGEHNQVSLDLVDRDTSARLNKGRQFQFRLPPPKG